MLNLTIGNTSQNVVVTFNEKKTLPEPVYRFVFTHVVTKETITLDINSIADLSNYPERYNEYEINTSVVFSGATPGQWQYIVTELGSGVKIENGKMSLRKPTGFAFTGYEPATTYKGYGG